MLKKLRGKYSKQIGSDDHQEILKKRRDEYAEQMGSDEHQVRNT